MSTLVSSFFGIVRDGVHAREVAWAVFLGTLAGFVSGWNLTLGCVLLAVLIVRVPWKIVCQTWAASAMLAWMITPVTFRAGRLILDESPVGTWLAPYSESLWFVLFDFDRYTLIGGIIWGLAAAICFSIIAGRLTSYLQDRFRRLHEVLKADERWSSRLSIRLACWAIFGSAAAAKLKIGAPRTFRPFGLTAAALIALPSVVTAWMYGDQWIERSMMQSLSLANQAEVSAERFELSFQDGLLKIQNLEVADPDDLAHNRLVVSNVTAKIKAAALVRGRVHIEQVMVEGLETNVARSKPAESYGIRLPSFPGTSDDDADDETGETNTAKWERKLDEYVDTWQELKPKVEKAREWLELLEKYARRQEDEQDIFDRDPAEMVDPEYHTMHSLRSSFGRSRPPRLLAQQIRVAGLPASWKLGEGAAIEVLNLNSHPSRTGQPTQFKCAFPEHRTLATFDLNLHHRPMEHTLHVESKKIELARLVKLEKIKGELEMRSGHLDIVGDGNFTSQDFALPVSVHAYELDVKVREGERLAGVSADLWNTGLAQLGGLNTQASLSGQWKSPRLNLNTDALVQQFRDQLQAAGHHMLAQAVDREVGRGERKTLAEVDRGIAKVQKATDTARQDVRDELAAGRAKMESADAKLAAETAEAQARVANETARTQELVNSGATKADREIDRSRDKANAEVERGLDKLGLAGLAPGASRYLAGSSSGTSEAGAPGLLDAAAGRLKQTLSGTQQQANTTVANTGSQAGAAVQGVDSQRSAASRYVGDRYANVENLTESTGDRVDQQVVATRDKTAAGLHQAGDTARAAVAPPKQNNVAAIASGAPVEIAEARASADSDASATISSSPTPLMEFANTDREVNRYEADIVSDGHVAVITTPRGPQSTRLPDPRSISTSSATPDAPKRGNAPAGFYPPVSQSTVSQSSVSQSSAVAEDGSYSSQEVSDLPRSSQAVLPSRTPPMTAEAGSETRPYVREYGSQAEQVQAALQESYQAELRANADSSDAQDSMTSPYSQPEFDSPIYNGTDESSPTTGSRIGNWTRSVGSKVRSVFPFGKKEQDTGIAPVDTYQPEDNIVELEYEDYQEPAVQQAQEKKWYQFWR